MPCEGQDTASVAGTTWGGGGYRSALCVLQHGVTGWCGAQIAALKRGALSIVHGGYSIFKRGPDRALCWVTPCHMEPWIVGLAEQDRGWLQAGYCRGLSESSSCQYRYLCLSDTKLLSVNK
jgi:hypothetical protein